MIHKINIDEAYVKAVLNGDKNIEIRYNDRGYQKGDIIEYTVKDSYTQSFDVSGDEVFEIEHNQYVITYVLNTPGLKENFVAFGIKKFKKDDLKELLKKI